MSKLYNKDAFDLIYVIYLHYTSYIFVRYSFSTITEVIIIMFSWLRKKPSTDSSILLCVNTLCFLSKVT